MNFMCKLKVIVTCFSYYSYYYSAQCNTAQLVLFTAESEEFESSQSRKQGENIYGNPVCKGIQLNFKQHSSSLRDKRKKWEEKRVTGHARS